MEPVALIREEPVLAAVAVPAPCVHPETLLAALPDFPAHAWMPSGEDGFAGLGAAASLDPFASRPPLDGVQALLRQVRHASREAHVRVFGGHAFQPGASDDPVWEALGESSFVLPRWSYHVDGGRGWLTFVGLPGALEGRTARAERRLIEHCLELGEPLEARAGDSIPPADGAAVIVEHQDAGRWAALVERARAEIAAGRCEKIVVARRSTVTAGRAFDAVEVLRRLRCQAGCNRFAVRRGATTFVGATPERLVRKSGLRVQTEALAGTAVGAVAGLLESTKDHAEHAPVLRALLRVLGPRCRRLSVPERPRLSELAGGLAHLRTPVEGELLHPTHVLELVAALHPTPAVGGEPTGEALAFIARHEPFRRGWYAAPIGWCDQRGDGEFAVALRSGVISGRRAWVFAGAGIVAASEAEAEYRETAAKLGPMLAALGARRS
jgi:isochorismate synthase